jgi:hypothetical protein
MEAGVVGHVHERCGSIDDVRKTEPFRFKGCAEVLDAALRLNTDVELEGFRRSTGRALHRFVLLPGTDGAPSLLLDQNRALGT